MKIEDLKVGDVLLYTSPANPDINVTQTVKLITDNQLILENEDNCKSLEVVFKSELDGYRIKPKTKKLYAYTLSNQGGMVKFYTDCDDSNPNRAPEFDIEYKE
jgi:hypothetical protein